MTFSFKVSVDPIKVDIQFPALDRTVAYLEARDDSAISALTSTVNSLVDQLQQSRTALKAKLP